MGWSGVETIYRILVEILRAPFTALIKCLVYRDNRWCDTAILSLVEQFKTQ